MEPTFFLAKFWGSVLILIPLCYLFRTESLHKVIRSLGHEETILIYVLAGYIAIFLGLTTIILHPTWPLASGWLIPVIGWSALVSGALHVVFADKLHLLARKVAHKIIFLKLSLLISLLLGVIILLPF